MIVTILIIILILIYNLKNIYPEIVPLFGLNDNLFLHKYYFWQLITFSFFHNTTKHLLLNLFWLWQIGTEIESSIGTKRFCLFYILSQIISGLFIIIINYLTNNFQISIGASGAICSFIVIYVYLFPNKYVFHKFIKIKYVLIFLLITTALLNFYHIGGVIAGIMLLLIFHIKFKGIKDSTLC